MTRKEMILEYCLIYVDVIGRIPDKNMLEQLPDKQLKILYDQMVLLEKSKRSS